MNAIESIDAKMTTLTNIRQDWIHQNRPNALADKMRSELKSLPANLPEIHKAFFKTFEKDLNRGAEGQPLPTVVETADSQIATTETIDYSSETPAELPPELARLVYPDGQAVQPQTRQPVSQAVQAESAGILAAGPPSLPVRNRCVDINGHVECFRMNNGLIHGGIIQTPSFFLVCRAFRFFIWKTVGKLFNGDEYQTDVVAGICEKRDKQGGLLERWGVDNRSIQVFNNYPLNLPTYAMRYDRTNLKEIVQSGYYYPMRFNPFVSSDFREHFKRGDKVIEVPDYAPPEYIPYNPPANFNAEFHQFKRSPTYETAVENALYNQPAICSDGFPICTQYIKVFSPSPKMGTVIVSLVSAYREKTLIGTIATHNRHASWSVKTFS
jgi:hypothetical protein